MDISTEPAAGARPTTGSAIELRGLTKSFRSKDGRVTAVNGVDLNIGRGEIVAFLGPNGAGKTTTLDIVLGLIEADSGSAEVLGREPRQAVMAGAISAVLQTGGLLRDLTVTETVQYIASTMDHARPVEEILKRAGLTGIAKRRVSKCSGGEQQRLRFALALLPDPDLLILDEPTAGMDVTARREFWDTMRADADSGRTVVFATHYLEEAETFAERIVMISGGQIVADGPTNVIREQYSGRTVSIDVPGSGAEEFTARIEALDGVTLVEQHGSRYFIRARDTDALALSLLGELGAKNLEIATADLESAFIALTGSSPVETTTDGGQS